MILGMLVTSAWISFQTTVGPLVTAVKPAGTGFVASDAGIEFVPDFETDFVIELGKVFVADETLSVVAMLPLPRIMMGPSANADVVAAARMTVKIKTFINSSLTHQATPKRPAAQSESEFVV